ncbi:hypothetical protein C6341_g22295 [Phytophthora cactorum]|nr:hypothetical protein C6341_g22295 [Phytophthora cactorum]
MEAEESGAVDGERKKKPLKLETLLEKGNKQTPTHIAARAGFAEGVEILRNSPRDVAANFALKDTHGYTAAQVAHSVAVHARALVNPAQEPWDEEKIAKEATRGRQLSNADCGNVPRCDDATDEEAQQDRAVMLANSRSKRARKEVDYVALAKELVEHGQQH